MYSAVTCEILQCRFGILVKDQLTPASISPQLGTCAASIGLGKALPDPTRIKAVQRRIFEFLVGSGNVQRAPTKSIIGQIDYVRDRTRTPRRIAHISP